MVSERQLGVDSWSSLIVDALAGSARGRLVAMSNNREKHLSTTALARLLGKESKELFVLLTSGGWIVKVDNHWQLTEKGKFEGGIYVNHPKYGEYIAWPESVSQHPLLALLPEAPLGATQLGHKFELPARLINLLLAERGWIKKHLRGWLLAPAGQSLGGQQHQSEQSAIPYVTWPESLLDHADWLHLIAQVKGELSGPTLDGRELAQAGQRMIANWLYLAGLAYASNYPWSLSSDTQRSDFFVPSARLAIDYWPSQVDAAGLGLQLQRQQFYRERKQVFVELRDEDLPQIDEILARALFRQGIAVY